MARRSPLFLALASLGSWAPAQAATITVNTNDPAVNPGDGLCSLTEAIQNANGDNESSGGDCVGGNGADTIELPAAQTITLTSALPNLLGDVTIVGNQARIERADTGCNLDGNPDAGEFRLLAAKVGDQTVTLSDFTLANGCADGSSSESQRGGAFFGYDSYLTLQGMRFEGNRAGVNGGAVLVGVENVGSVTIRQTTFEGNQAGLRGGAVFASSVATSIEDSVFTGNQANVGGAFDQRYSNATVTRSTFSGNAATSDGGAISFRRFGGLDHTLTLTDSTLSGNTAGLDGGGINSRGTISIQNSTLSGNSAGTGGAINLADAASMLQMTDSTLVDNTAGGSASHVFAAENNQATVYRTLLSGGGASACYLGGLQSGGDNLVTEASCSALGATVVSAGALQLGPLQDNGGPTQTFALGVGSVAIDAGGSGCGATDQRGSGRPADGDDNGSVFCDVGAFEVGETPSSGPNFVVNATTDVGDGVCGAVAGQCTLREAVLAANSDADASIITFDPGVFASAQTVTLGQGQIPITTSTTITGPGRELLTVDANAASRHFLIDNGSVDVIAASLSDLSLVNGNAIEGGGAIRAEESLTLSRVTLQNNRSSAGGALSVIYSGQPNAFNVVIDDALLSQNTATYGGAMHAIPPEGSSIYISNSQFLDNLASRPGDPTFGGAAVLGIQYGSMRIEDSTFSGNVLNSGSSAKGGGLYLFGYDSGVTLQRVTVSGNSAGGSTGQGQGGGLYAGVSGSFSLTDSVISGNTSGGGGSSLRRNGGAYVVLFNMAEGLIERTTFSDNVALAATGGVGLIALSGASLTLDSSTVSGNSAGANAGGLYALADESSTLTVSNSTISGNAADREAGGAMLAAFDPGTRIDMVGSTITNNLADANANGADYGGGMVLFASNSAVISIGGTAIAGNATGGSSTQTDITALGEPFLIGNSLIGNNDGSGLAEAPVGMPDGDNNLIGGATNGLIDPGLGILTDHGGSTFTHRPIDSSPLIDHYTGCTGTDQIGQARGLDGDGTPGDDCDIGAVEFDARIFRDGFENVPLVKRFDARQALLSRDEVLDRLPTNGQARVVLRAPGASPDQSLVIVHARRFGDRIELQLNRLEQGVWMQGKWQPFTGESSRLRW